MQLAGVLDHLPRVQHQLGKPLRLGERQFRVRGYHANRQSVSLDHERHLLEAFRRALALRPGTFVDVGANTGQTLLKLLSLEPDRDYVGFEPQAGCCHCLQQFATDNGLTTVQVLPLALSDRDGVLKLYSHGDGDQMASQQGRSGTRALWVPRRRGDGVLSELGVATPGIIKIDVEGAELEVLRGLSETIARSAPILFFEVLPNFVGEDRLWRPDTDRKHKLLRAAEIMSLLVSHGYCVCQIDNDAQEYPITRFDLDDREGFRGPDFVALPPDIRPMTVRLNKTL